MSAAAYRYRAVDAAGARRRGVVSASGEAEAFRKVSAMGLTPLRLSAGAGSDRPAALRGRTRVPTRELSHFTYQLGVLVSSRIPLSEGLRSIAEQERDGPLRAIVSDVARRIESGEQVAQALDAHRAALGELYVETVRAAEKTGTLARSLEQLSDALERTHEMGRQVRGALTYPACVCVILSLATAFLVGFVVPRFARMFEDRHVQLPVFTRALMTLGKSMQSFWWAYLAAAAIVTLAAPQAWRSRSFRRRLDDLLGRVPHVGPLMRGVAVARFARVLGLSISAGLGLLESLDLAGRACGHGAMSEDAAAMSAQVRRGGRLCDALPSCRQMSPFTRRMLAAGEQSGELPKMCSIVARHYERETGYLVKNLATVIEPVMIVAIAAVVLVVALAIFLPMWDMVKLVG